MPKPITTSPASLDAAQAQVIAHVKDDVTFTGTHGEDHTAVAQVAGDNAKVELVAPKTLYLPVSAFSGTTGRNTRKWGLHCMYSMASQSPGQPDGAVDAAYKLGARFFNTIDIGPDGWKKQAAKYPDAWFICRETYDRNNFPDPQWLADKFGLDPSWPANCIIVGLNEDDGGVPFSNVDGMQRRFDWDQQFYSIVKSRAPNVRVAASVYFPTDKPDEKHLADKFKATYVQWANQGGDRWLDFHNYGRDANTLWSVNAAGEAETLFFEMRAVFGLRHGLDPRKTKVIYSESGVDHMGIGGFNQLGFTVDQLKTWMARYDDLHRQYGLDELALGATFYQLCDSQPQPLGRGEGAGGDWWGYEIWPIRDAMSAFYSGSVIPDPGPDPGPDPEDNPCGESATLPTIPPDPSYPDTYDFGTRPRPCTSTLHGEELAGHWGRYYWDGAPAGQIEIYIDGHDLDGCRVGPCSEPSVCVVGAMKATTPAGWANYIMRRCGGYKIGIRVKNPQGQVIWMDETPTRIRAANGNGSCGE